MTTVVIFYSFEDLDLLQQITSELRKNGVTDRSITFDMARGETEGSDATILQVAASADCVVLLWSRALAASARAPLAVHAAIQSWSRDRFVLGKPDDTPLAAGLRDLAAQPLKSAPILESISPDTSQEDIRFLVRLVAERIRGRWPIAPGMDWNDMHRRDGPTAPAMPPPSYAHPPSPRPPPMTSHAPKGAPTGSLHWLVIASVVAILLLVAKFVATPNRDHRPPPILDPTPTPLTPGMDLTVFASAIGMIGMIGLFALLVVVLMRFLSMQRTKRAKPATKTTASAEQPPLRDVLNPRADSRHQVFISYSRSDAAQVNALTSRIEAAGFTVWIDTQSSDAVPRYAGRIVGAIRSSNVVALMCSRDAFASDHVIREVYVAGDFKKPFVAVQLDEADFPDDLLYFLSGFPRILAADFAPERLRQEIKHLLPA